jgi:hypothetical protein
MIRPRFNPGVGRPRLPETYTGPVRRPLAGRAYDPPVAETFTPVGDDRPESHAQISGLVERVNQILDGAALGDVHALVRIDPFWRVSLGGGPVGTVNSNVPVVH